MLTYELQKLSAETKSSFSQLFVITAEAVRQFETGEYFVMFAKGAKRVRNILGIEREILILGNVYADQQARSVQFARRLINEYDGRLETTLCVIVHQDPRGNTKLKRWGRENGLAIIPVYTDSGILPRGQELERLLSYEFFTQDPFDVTGPVANDAQFFGRRTEEQELARKLQAGHIRSCFGIRKIGKTLLVYAYSHGVRSSRAIERLCGRDAGYRFIVGDAVPDHTVIARFRQRHVAHMREVFMAVLRLCREAGLIRLGPVALDGTKVRANAARAMLETG